MNKKITQRNSLDNSETIEQFFSSCKEESLLSYCQRKYRSKWQVLRLLLLVTELTQSNIPLTGNMTLLSLTTADDNIR